MSYDPTFSTRTVDITRNNTVYVESVNALPVAVANVITLISGTHYIFTKPVNLGTNQLKIPDGGIVQISTTNAVSNLLTTEITGTTPLFFGNITRLSLAQLNVFATAGHCFNLSNNITPGFTFLDQCTFIGFDSLGTIEGGSFATENVGWFGGGAGLTLNNMLLIIMREQAFNTQTGNHVSLTGTLIGAIFEDIIMAPATGDAFLDIDSSLTITDRILVIDNLFSDSAGGTLFDPTGLDQTHVQVAALNNGVPPDSDQLVSKSAAYTILPTDGTIQTTGASSFPLTLPTAVGVQGKEYNIKHFGTGTITLDADGSELIDGELQILIGAGYSGARPNMHIKSDGVGWMIV